MASKRMTANPIRPARHRPGKAAAEVASSSEEEESGAEEETEEQEAQAPQAQQPQRRVPPPKASSFPSAEARNIASNLKDVDLNERRKEAELKERARLEQERQQQVKQEKDAGFVTDSEEEDDDDEDGRVGIQDSLILGSLPTKAARKPPPRTGQAVASDSDDDDDDDDDSSEEEDSSSEDEAPKLLRPVFVRKDQRAAPAPLDTTPSLISSDLRRREAADALVAEKSERDALARAAGKKAWDDDTADPEGIVDDTDGLEPELERQQWVARELARLKRARAALEEREAELAEVERRRNLSAAERAAEDEEFLAAQKAEQEGKGKAGFMARYHHRGAFAGAAGEEGDQRTQELLSRDLMGAQYEGQEGLRETMPEYLQVRDQMQIGRKGRTKHKDLRSEDTGKWGDLGRERRGGAGGGAFVEDERFRPDRPGGFGGPGMGGGAGGTGANAGQVGDRKRAYGDAGTGDAKRPRYEGAERG